MPDIATIAILVIAVVSLVLSAYVLWVCRFLESAVGSINNGHAALNESQQALLSKMKHVDNFCYDLSDRTVRAANQLRSLKRLSDLEDAEQLAQYMKKESKRYADLSRDYQARTKVLKKGVQS